jgi:hypothetical protein
MESNRGAGQEDDELALAVGGDTPACSTDGRRALEHLGEAGEPLPDVGERMRRVRPLGRGLARERRGVEQLAVRVALDLEQVGADSVGSRLEAPERVVDLVEGHGSVRYVASGGSVAVPAGIKLVIHVAKSRSSSPFARICSSTPLTNLANSCSPLFATAMP